MVKKSNAVTAELPPNPFNKLAGKAVQSEQPTENSAMAPAGQHLKDKKLKRAIADREYSKRYRQRKLQYKAKLETEVEALQAELRIMEPRKKSVDEKHSLLRAENQSLKQKLSAYTRELGIKQAQYAELKRERENQKQVYAYYGQQFYQNINFPFWFA